jgi:acetyltransferase
MALESFGDFTNRTALAVISTGGGRTVMTADACAKYQVPLARFAPETSRRMREFVPAFASVENNPADITPLDADAIALGACVVALEAPETDCVILVLAAEDLKKHEDRVVGLASVSRASNTPLAIGLSGVDAFGTLDPELKSSMAEAELPVFSSPVRAIQALGLIRRFDPHRSQDAVLYEVLGQGERVSPSGPNAEFLHSLLKRFDVAIPASVIVSFSEDLIGATKNLIYPVVAKVLSDFSSYHKSDLGLVTMGIASADELLSVRNEYCLLAQKLWPNGAPIRLLIQEQVSNNAVEVLVGGVRHAEFGPIVTVGSGGKLTELLNDVQFGLAPISEVAAESLFMRTRVSQLVTGYRGSLALDLESCVGAIVAVSKMISETDELMEIEINPLMVGSIGSVAVDVRATYVE